VLADRYLVRNRPISGSVYTTSPEIPIMSRESLLALIVLLALGGSFLLRRVASTEDS
jgi:hypothetical protein